jgi:hypothetical protein
MKRLILACAAGSLCLSPLFALAASAVPQQTISSFSPASGAPGTVVTIKGSGFTGSNAAWAGNAQDAALKVLSDSQVTVTIPADATTGAIGILNAANAAFTATSFTVTSAAKTVVPQQSISSFSPVAGAPGTVVTISGAGFTGSTAAWVGNAHDASLKVVSDRQVTVTIPADATTGAIGILNSANAVFTPSSFTVQAAKVTAPAPTPTPAPAPVPAASGLAIRVQGNQFVDGGGKAVQLRGVNFSGFEYVAVQGWDPGDPSGGQGGQANGPKWSAIKAWKANVVRIPLNEASWLGYACTDLAGKTHNPDPGANYKAVVESQVTQAIAAGLYVILDLHWAAPGTTCPMLQAQMADADHSLAFWSSVATLYKNNPAVMFELFNEPFLDFEFSGSAWQYLMKGTGGSFSGYPATDSSGAWSDVKHAWAIASYQQMINAVRATGASNVVLVGALQYTQDLSGWLANRPSDPQGQMAATWHAYPTFGTAWGTTAYAQPNLSPQIWSEVQAVRAAGFPVIATETGDQNSAGTVGSPLVANVTAFADKNGVSVIGWAWDVWGDADNVLVKDVNGTPTDGYGLFFHNWLLNHP